MEFSIKIHTINSEWSIVCIKGSQIIISKNIEFLSLKIDFVLASCADSDEMLHFIWNFNVCESTCIGVSSLQRAKPLVTFSTSC